MFISSKDILPQEPRKVQTRRVKVFIAMLTPVTKERRFTAKREPIPDRAEMKNALKKLPDFIITISVIRAASMRNEHMIKECSGIVFSAVCTE